MLPNACICPQSHKHLIEQVSNYNKDRILSDNFHYSLFQLGLNCHASCLHPQSRKKLKQFLIFPKLKFQRIARRKSQRIELQIYTDWLTVLPDLLKISKCWKLFTFSVEAITINVILMRLYLGNSSKQNIPVG